MSGREQPEQRPERRNESNSSLLSRIRTAQQHQIARQRQRSVIPENNRTETNYGRSRVGLEANLDDSDNRDIITFTCTVHRALPGMRERDFPARDQGTIRRLRPAQNGRGFPASLRRQEIIPLDNRSRNIQRGVPRIPQVRRARSVSYDRSSSDEDDNGQDAQNRNNAPNAQGANERNDDDED